jgi:hypothetical protein
VLQDYYGTASGIKQASSHSSDSVCMSFCVIQIQKMIEGGVNTRFEVFMAMKIQVEFFWVVMLYSVVVQYQC